MNSGSATQTFTFTTLGKYDYICLPHENQGMRGSITVSNVTPTLLAQPLSSALNIFPNPVRGGQATIGFSEAKSGQAYRLRVSNVIGREVRTVIVRPELLSAGQPLDFSNLPAGIYFCTLLSNDKAIATKRVTLQN